MLSSAHVLAMDAKHLLDVVDDLRIKHPQCNERLLREQSLHYRYAKSSTLWCQLEDMFQLIVTPQGIEKVLIQLIDKVYAMPIGARLFL